MKKTHILMCTHNGEHYVREQLESILMQDPAPDAIHVHDFRSADATAEIVANVAAASKLPIYLVRHADAPGAARSFFRAMKALSAEVAVDDIVFLADQDDVWLPGKLEKIVKIFRQESAAGNTDVLAFHDVKVVDALLNEIRPTYYTGNPFSLPTDLSPERLLLANAIIGHTMALSGSLLKRVVATVNPTKYLMHDWSISMFASRFGRIIYLSEALSLYRQHQANVLGAYKKKPFIDIVRRAPKFAAAVVEQAIGFTQDCKGIPIDGRPVSVDLDRRMSKAIDKGRLHVCLILALSAMKNGPTVKRKLLAAPIMMYGLFARPSAS